VVGPRRPEPGRRRALARSGRSRATTRRTTAGTGAPAAERRRATALTTRAAVLGLVLCGLVVSAALPLRELLAQRGQIATAEQAQTARLERVAALEEQRRALDDPTHVQALARERLHYVMPGETAYIVLAPEGGAVTADPAKAQVVPAGPGAPWWSQLWGSVQAADQP
jgi:cell division protein FtsB